MSSNTVSRPVGLRSRLTSAFRWRWQWVVLPRVKRLLGIKNQQWARVVMDRVVDQFVLHTLPHRSLRVLEISGMPDSKWREVDFASYRVTTFPDYDVCGAPLAEGPWDLIIAEQVLEHVERPWAAVRNVHSMLTPGGYFVVSTPFLIRVHGFPGDHSRWTEQGLRQLLVEGGFDDANITTNAWGNRACVRANFMNFREWIPWWHSLRNEPNFPVVVWAFARRAS